jgi:hypothetical protein
MPGEGQASEDEAVLVSMLLSRLAEERYWSWCCPRSSGPV